VINSSIRFDDSIRTKKNDSQVPTIFSKDMDKSKCHLFLTRGLERLAWGGNKTKLSALATQEPPQTCGRCDSLDQLCAEKSTKHQYRHKIKHG